MSNIPGTEPTGEAIGLALHPEQAPVEPPRRSGWFIAVFAFAFFGLAITNVMPVVFSLAYKVQTLDEATKEANLGLIVGIGALVSVIAMPVAGVLSDRTRLRWGRRKPWLAFSLVLNLVGAVIIALSPNIPTMLVGWILAIIGYSFATAALSPFLAEQVPMAQRGKAGAFGGVMFQLSGVAAALLGSMLTGNLLLMFLLPVIVAAVSALLYFVVVPDRPATAAEASASIAQTLRKLVFNPLKYTDFAWVWAGKFLITMGMQFFSTYQLYFLLDRLGFTPETVGGQLALVGGIGILVATGFAIIGGILSDRVKKRKVFIYAAAVLIIGGLVVLAFASDTLGYTVGALLIIAGSGMFGSVDLALASDIVPEPEQAGRWMSIYQVSANLPGSIAPLLAPLLLMIGGGANYTVLFLTGAVVALGAIITTWRIRNAR